MVEKFCRHIEKLLAHHEYVVVPNLGGFVVQMKSAQILTDYITPPLATIGFNPLMLHADGLLAIEIARTEQISYRLAMEYIDKEVENIKFKLNSFGNAKIGNLGFIQKDSLGNFIFQPSENSGYLPQNLGLTDLYISERKENSVDEPRKISFTLPTNRTFKYAAAVLLILGLFVFTNNVSDVKQTNSANLASLNLVNSPKTEIQPALQTKTDSDSTRIESAVIKPLEIERFHVVVASLPTQKSAESFCNSLIDEKFPTAHILPPVKTYRVAIKSFSDKNEAIQYMENLRKTDQKFENAWVLCK